MGTSLSGLTPATTFDGLLKTSDNEPLDGTLKTISDGSGVDSALQLSNSALQVNGDLNVGSVHKIYQDTNNLNIVGNSGSTSLKYFTNFGNNNTNKFGLNNFFRYAVGIGFTDVQSSATLNVKGSGSSSATTSLLVQNSSESNVFSITDDGLFTFNDVGGGDALTIENGSNISQIRYNDNLWLGSSHGTYVPTLKIDRTAGLSVETNSGSLLNLLYDTGNLGIGETTPTARLHVKAGTTQDVIARFQDPLQTWSYIDIKNDSVLTDYTGIFWGSKAKIRSKEVGPIFIDCSGGISFLDGNSAKSNINSQGAIAIGANAAPASTMAYIKGSGTTSATTALLVQNSAGTEHLKITDDGVVNVRQALNVNHPTFSTRTLKLGWGSIFATDNTSELSIGAVYSQTTAPRIVLGGKTRAGGADAVLVQALNGMYLSTTASTEDPSAQLHIKGSGNDATTTALLVQNSDGDDLMKVDDLATITLGRLDAATGGILVRGEQNEIRSNILYYRAKTGGYLGRFDSNGFQVGNGATGAAAKLQVKGSGTTSATTALLVQNSAGTDLLKVNDAGEIGLGATPTTNARAFIKSAGSTPATNALVIQNSLSTNLFKVQSDGKVYASNLRSTINSSSIELLQDVDFSGGDNYNFNSTTGGFLPPRMTTTERDAISTPAAGLMIYNTTTNKAQCYNGSTWNDLF